MKFIDFFAGIGGFRRGMELAGHECVGFCEFDKFATASYTSMHLLTQEQREFLSKMPLKQRQKEILKEEYRNGEWYANDIRRVYAGDIPKAEFVNSDSQLYKQAGNGVTVNVIRAIAEKLGERDGYTKSRTLQRQNGA